MRPSTESSNTTHITAADGDGNIACMTQTINAAFGSKVMVPGTGILLNNTMALFDPHPGRPNSVAGGRRMTSSMCPTIITRDGQPFLALGTPGGVRIYPSVLQAIVNVIDHGMNLQEAVEAPRVWTQGQELEVEKGVPVTVRAALAERGHRVTAVTTVAGGMNGIGFDQARGTMTGAACWRADGVPMALAGGPARPGIRFQPTVTNTQETAATARRGFDNPRRAVAIPPERCGLLIINHQLFTYVTQALVILRRNDEESTRSTPETVRNMSCSLTIAKEKL